VLHSIEKTGKVLDSSTCGRSSTHEAGAVVCINRDGENNYMA